jgi:beta-glucosidase-like glycosyl hydrolase/CubicO group peptidase (beta-lactamase class C family)
LENLNNFLTLQADKTQTEMMKRFLILLALAAGMGAVGAQSALATTARSQQTRQNREPEFVRHMYGPWVDSVYNSLTLKERIAQMIFVELRPAVPSTVTKALREARELKVGGAVLFRSNLPEAAGLINSLQGESQTPMLVAIDGEWGLGMRLTDVEAFPYQMALGAMRDTELLYEMGEEVARQARRAGIHINLAPTVDVNNNAANPVIGYRSFGEDPARVAESGLAYIRGMEAGGIVCTAKHFPGHGDTAVDSHADLPLIAHDRERLERVELAPFRELVRNGATGVMTAHLNVPALTGSNLPTSLSRPIITGLLREQWGYNGLVVTDALDMQGIAKFHSPGEAARLAALAGNDVLELVRDPRAAIDAIYAAVQSGEIAAEQIEQSVRRILAVKYYVGLDKLKPVEARNIVREINSPEARLLARRMVAGSLVALQNNDGVLPLETQKYERIAVVSLRTDNNRAFFDRFSKYFRADRFVHNYRGGLTRGDAILDTLAARGYDLIVVEADNFTSRPASAAGQPGFGVTAELQKFVGRLTSENANVVVALFGMPYVMDHLPAVKDARAVLFSQTSNDTARDLAAQALCGAIDVDGTLPVTTRPYPIGTGVRIEGGIRLAFGIGEEVGIDSERLERAVDSIVYASIRNGAYPGCQLLIARDGKVIFDRSYGNHTYTGEDPVTPESVYDIASNTKICAALPIYMTLYDRGMVDLDVPISAYLPGLGFERSNKRDVTLRSQLSHIAGFQPTHPFWEEAAEKGLISARPSRRHTVRIDRDMWASEKVYEMVYRRIRDLPLTEENKMVYSCLGFVLAPHIIENITGENFWDYLDRNIYDPLGITLTGFNPLTRMGLAEEQVVPSEFDAPWRGRLVHGFVHDEASGVLGGYSSNAGLFSNTMGIAEIFQMYMNKGEYGGRRFFSSETFDTFNTQYFTEHGNYRALGFEKAVPANRDRSIVDAWPAPSTSPEAFGHSGFTGTYAWGDPANGTIYIFLSNRVYPTRQNPAFDKMQSRVGIHELVYQMIEEKSL